jgi:nucleotide-binding universal stress UspA family protein
MMGGATVAHHLAMTTTQPIRHILVAHDLSDTSDAALEYALNLARPLGARVTILHAYEIPSLGAPELLILATDWTKQIGVVAGERLDQIAASARTSGTAVTAEVREGAAWREIDAFAREGAVDLVVVGSHGRRGLPHALLGSVAEKIVRTAPCPVLVVRAAAQPR